jgi:histidinol-phosphate aminotransferase
VTRGSSEGIDLLVRSFCSAGQDDVLQTPPVFALYEVYASVQGAACINVPLRPERGFALDTDALLAACDERTKLIFLCSPNNPIGTIIPRADILEVVQARAGKSVVVVDEAYIEYSDAASLASLVSEYDNLVVLRTLSKAMALAGVRCGAVIASAALIQLLDGVLAPYAVASPVIRYADDALSAEQVAAASLQIEKVVSERERLSHELNSCKSVQRVWPSQANFVLVRFRDLASIERSLENNGIAIRTFDGSAALDNCARITVSSATDNDRLIEVIRGLD